MQIKHKLIISYLTIALLAEVMGYLGIQAIAQNRQDIERVTNRDIPIINEVKRINCIGDTIISQTKQINFFNRINLLLGKGNNIVINQELARQLDDIKATQNLYQESLGNYEKLVNNFYPQDIIYLEKAKIAGKRIIQTSEEVVKLNRPGVSEREIMLKSLELKELKINFTKDINFILEAKYKELNEINLSISSRTERVKLTIKIVSFLVLSIVATIAWAIPLSIAKNLAKIKYSIAEVSAGRLKHKIFITTKDEMGELADAFNKMTESIRQTIDYGINVCENIKESLIVVTPSAAIASVNQATCEMLAYTKEELLGQPIEILFAEAKSLFRGAGLNELIQKGSVRTIETTYLSKDGREIPILFSGSVIRNDNDTIQGIVCLAQDITERKRVKEELERSLSLVRATLESTADGILVLNREQIIQSYNHKFVEMWRLPEPILSSGDGSQALAVVLNQIKDPGGFVAKLRTLFNQIDLESYDVIEFNDGRILECYAWPQRLDGSIFGKVFSFRDVTERKQSEEIMRYQAWYDQLTGLPNRILFSQRLSISLTYATQNKGMLGVMFLDLDRFKIINDTLGHAVGDQLLESVAQRITDSLRGGDMVARWGGDEFTVLLPQVNNVEDAINIANRVLDSLKPAFHLDGYRIAGAIAPLHISSSIGIALYPDDGTDAETLIKNADAALYRAKEHGRNNYQLYTAAMSSEASELLVLENSLHHALERGEFLVYYQPQINTSTDKITQIEALVRWQHPELGLIFPNKFIPLAEETGLIVPIGEWVLRTACMQNKAWQDAGFSPLRVAVNLSARQFKQPNLVKMITGVLAQTGLEPKFLELEITETTAMQDVDFSKTILTNLHDMGIRIAIDDFGTGYSSLSYLKKFPFDTLKIDQSFVQEMTVDPYDVAIAKAVMALGQGLNLSVVAEGVETKEQLAALQALQCEEMQGYFFSYPLPALDITKLLQRLERVQVQ